MSLTPAERTLRARVGAYALHARRDPLETTRAARETFLANFERRVDPDGLLDPADRKCRALAARHEHFARLALRSVMSRSRNRKAAPAKGRPSQEERHARPRQPQCSE